MELTENLKDIIAKQKEVLAQLETEYKILESSNTVQENARLKSELEKLKSDYQIAKSNVSTLEVENAAFKNALYEQIYNEKIKLVNTTEQRLNIFFKSSVEGEQNRLSAMENSVKSRIDSITSTLRHNNIDIKDEIYTKLDDLTLLLNQKVTEARTKINHVSTAFSQAEKDELESLKNEQITDEQMISVAKKNNVERFVGLNLLNAVGIFLIIVGVITAARYTYAQLPAMLKGIMMFVLGGLMLIAGELMNRKKSNIFSLGITAGGIGVLYVALATSFFGLKILGMYPAVAVCVLITGVAFILSIRYSSQVILSFALIGGYLPVFSIGSDSVLIYGVMLYFVALNLLALMVSFNKKWRVPSFIGLVLNIFGTLYICFSSVYNSNTSIAKQVIVILYAFFAFLIYTLIPIISTYRTKGKFKKADVALLAINTTFSSLIMYGVFYVFRIRDFEGVLAIIFASIYLLLGWFIEKGFANEEKNTQALFYITGLVFVVLVIPIQFGRAWLSLGWLAEGVCLATYGILYNDKAFRRAGIIISGLCLWAFLTFDCFFGINYLFAYKYLAISVGSLIILGAYIRKKMIASRFVTVYKYFTLINLWLYMLYIIRQLADMMYDIFGGNSSFSIDYLIAATAIIGTFALAYALPRIKILYDTGVKIISIVLYVLGILGLFLINSLGSPFNKYALTTTTLGTTLLGTMLLVVVGLISLVAVRDLMKLIVTGRKLSVEWYPLIISGYFVLILTQNLITQYNLSFSSAVISIIYVLTALTWIVLGFTKRYSFIRRFGLGLAILSVIKLFLIDLSTLTQGYQIISYFVLGVTLVAISFVYQYFSKRLELKMEVRVDDVEKD